MKAQQLFELFTKHENTQKLIDFSRENKPETAWVKGLSGSSRSIWCYNIHTQTDTNTLIITPSHEDAVYLFNDLEVITNNSENLHFFPSSIKQNLGVASKQTTDHDALVLRTEALNAIQQKHNKLLIISYSDAIMEKVVAPEDLTENTLCIGTGEKISVDFLIDLLLEYQFQRVDFVYEAGQFAVRGSIVDIFSYSNDYPFRVDFFGQEVESLRTFDTTSQLSVDKLDTIDIIPNIQNSATAENLIPIFDFIPHNTLIIANELPLVLDVIEAFGKKLTQSSTEETEIQRKIIGKLQTEQLLDKFTIFETGIQCWRKAALTIKYNTQMQPAFNKNFDLLIEDWLEKQELGYKHAFLTENLQQGERLRSILDDKNFPELAFSTIPKALHEGFVEIDQKITCYTDHQLFQRYHRYKPKTTNSSRGKESFTLKELNDLQPGDYIVHVDHGVGIFGGLEKIDNQGKTQETIRLVYRDKDVLFVGVHALHKISKYRGKDSETPKINKLGSGAWNRLKQKTKKKVKDIATELIALYAKRKENEGFTFSPDSYMQYELESSFIYEDTPDQAKATLAVKDDMESKTPMDRLVCGDVGFGKTEVAIRAAFKSATDGKQVAVLVPTTILAFQHYRTFSRRLREFPVTVDYISRNKSAKNIKETLKKLESGAIDIIIGTHRLVSKDVQFKDLGLMIVDEEQKFGVSVKEKLKALKINVDTLTLTATPIPRTMQFSLMGARDLSIINTPPPNRYPILTELHSFNKDIIREAINYEMQRNGQVFFIHNRIDTIQKIDELIAREVPEARVAVAHGRMDGKALEKIMLDFINESYDVLIATTIIESGLDIPNANTIIINNAQNFGLSDLHQLRGRVGRSNKKAFCYLLAPPLSAVSNEARRRLQAIEQFSDLGSGFNIALQDLDIRGAGNLLGGEQSGFIAEIGFETYQRILDEALLELRENEFKNLWENETDTDKKEELTKKHESIGYINDCQIDTDLELLFPDAYIENIAERLKLYRELDTITTQEVLTDFRQKLIDRFGKMPRQSEDLLNVVPLRWKAMQYGMEKIILKNSIMICFFVSNQQSPFYESKRFIEVINLVQKSPKKCKLKEANNKRSLVVYQITEIAQAYAFLNQLNA